MHEIEQKLATRLEKISLLTGTSPLSYSFSFDKVFILYGTQNEAMRVADLFALAGCTTTICQMNTEFLLTIEIEELANSLQ